MAQLTQKTNASRSVWIDPEGVKEIKTKMGQLQKDPKDMKPRGKKSWTIEYLEKQAYVDTSTIKRLINDQKPIDHTSAIAILDALGFDSSEFLEKHDRKQKIENQTLKEDMKIDWLLVSHEILREQQEEQQFRQRATEQGYEVKVFIPLGLVKRKRQQRRECDNFQKNPYQLEEEVIEKIYEHNNFLKSVIANNNSQSKHLAIIGEPGAGKTTWLNSIANYIKNNTECLVICISLASLQNKSLKQYILENWLPQALSLVYPEIDLDEFYENLFCKRLRQGQVWLLLDGVDEIEDVSSYSVLNNIQGELTDWLGKCRVVLTCRTNTWDIKNNNGVNNFDTYKIQELSSADIRLFIKQWFGFAKQSRQGKVLRERLDQSQYTNIKNLVKNPLLLSLFCQIYASNENQVFPQTKAELYQQFIDYFYEWKPNQTNIDWSTQLQLKDQLHCSLGNLSLVGLDSSALFRLPLGLIKQNMSDELFKLAWDLGLLNLVDRDAKTSEPVYAFFHPSFQEYFAALAINDWTFFLNHNNNNPDFLKKLNNKKHTYRIFQKQWHEVIFIWVNLFKQDEIKKFIVELINFQDYCKLWQGDIPSFYEYKSLFLALKIASEINSDIFIKDILSKIFIGIKPSGFINVKLASLYKDDNTTKSLGFFMDELIFENFEIANTNQKIEVILSSKININFNKKISINARYYLEKLKNSKKINGSSNKHDQKSNQKDILRFIYVLEKNHGEILKLNDITTDHSLNQNNVCIDKLVNSLIDLIKNSNYVKGISFNDLGMCCYVISFLGLLDYKKDDLVDVLLNIDVSVFNGFIWFRREIAKTILTIDPNNKKALKILKELIDFNDPINSLIILGDLLSKVPNDIEAFNMILMLITPSLDDDNFYYATHNLKSINSHDQLLSIIKNLKVYLSEENYQLNFTKFRDVYELFWHCSEHLNYPEFYKAWHNQPKIIHPEILEISPLGNTAIIQTLNQQIIDLPSQLQPTEKTYPLVINAKSLEKITSENSLSQSLCNKIYKIIFPQITNIPKVNDPSDLEREVIKIKGQIQKENIAVIFHKGEPNETLISVCEQLADEIDYKFITNQTIKHGFSLQKNPDNPVQKLQNWINELG